MKKGDYISTILRSEKTVFSFKDIVLLWGDSGNAARVRINYYLKNNDLSEWHYISILWSNFRCLLSNKRNKN